MRSSTDCATQRECTSGVFCDTSGSPLQLCVQASFDDQGGPALVSKQAAQQPASCLATQASSGDDGKAWNSHPSRAQWTPVNSEGKTLLDAAGHEAMYICSHPSHDCARQLQSLLASGAAHVWQKREDGDTALHLAVFSGNEQLVTILLHAGASCNACNLKGQTPLHLAVLARSSSTLLQMIEYGARDGRPQPQQVDISAQDAMGCSPLHVAAYVGHADSCRVLLRYGADSMQLDRGGRVALHHCTTMEVASVLVEHKPEAVKVADEHGLLPSHYAAMRNILPMLSVLVHHPGAAGSDFQGMQPLHYAVLHDCSSGVVDRMCTACDVNAADCMNLTALDYCIYKGDSERADLMVKNGARMDPVLLLRTKCKRLTEESGSSTAPAQETKKRSRDEQDVTSTCMELLAQHEQIAAAFRYTSRKYGRQEKVSGPGAIELQTPLDSTANTSSTYYLAQAVQDMIKQHHIATNCDHHL